MPRPFCVRPSIDLHIVPNLLCQAKRWFPFSKFSFCASTKTFEAALNAIQFFVVALNIWTVTNLLGPVEGQGNRYHIWAMSLLTVISDHGLRNDCFFGFHLLFPISIWILISFFLFAFLNPFSIWTFCPFSVCNFISLLLRKWL